jgi:DNA-binding transcriptional regulator YdaS (Cro superfamily)
MPRQQDWQTVECSVMSDDNFYTLEESAAILGVSRSDVEQMIHRKELQSTHCIDICSLTINQTISLEILPQPREIMKNSSD